MRMLYPSLGHQSPEDPEFGEWEDYGWGWGNCQWIRLCLVLENDPRARTDILEPLPFHREKASVGGQLALGPGSAPGVSLEGLGRDPAGWGQEVGRDGCRDFSSLVLDSVSLKELFFLSFAKHFGKQPKCLMIKDWLNKYFL